jgi:hypothetical protein
VKGERVRTVLIVTVVTLLVWLFAESRTLRVETLEVPVEIGRGGQLLAFRIHPGQEWDASPEIELAGPTGLIEELRPRALDGIMLELGDELPSEPGSWTVDLREAIRRERLFAESGVTVRRVTPASLEIEIDRLERVMLPVEVELSGLETAGPVSVEPPEVEVRVPATHAEDLPDHATAKIDPARLATLSPGRRTELSQVPVILENLPPDLWGLRLVDARVTVELALRARTQSVQLAELPVWVELLPGDLAAWTVEIPPEDRVISGVTLTGPGAVIDRIRRGEVRPRAVVSLSTNDLARGVETVEVELVGLPPGVVADYAGGEVSVLVQPRGAAGGGG